MVREDLIDLDPDFLMPEYVRLLRNVVDATRLHRRYVTILAESKSKDANLALFALHAATADANVQLAIDQLDVFEQRVGDAVLARDAADGGAPSLGWEPCRRSTNVSTPPRPPKNVALPSSRSKTESVEARASKAC
jgi:hypothetical protein